MPNNFEKFKQPDKESASSSREKQGSSSDFAAGKPLRGILKRKRGDIQDIAHGKEHEDIPDRDLSKKANLLSLEINQFSDESIKKYRDTTFDNMLKDFRNTINDIRDILGKLNKSLGPEVIYKHLGGVYPHHLLQNIEKGYTLYQNMHENGKIIETARSFNSSFGFVNDYIKAAAEHLTKLQQLEKEHSEKLQQPKREVE
jgi:hypothetical protein